MANIVLNGNKIPFITIPEPDIKNIHKNIQISNITKFQCLTNEHKQLLNCAKLLCQNVEKGTLICYKMNHNSVTKQKVVYVIKKISDSIYKHCSLEGWSSHVFVHDHSLQQFDYNVSIYAEELAKLVNNIPENSDKECSIIFANVKRDIQNIQNTEYSDNYTW